jgi:hypothetical protein
MNWFDDDKKTYPTKMFINYLPEEKPEVESKNIGATLLAGGVQGIALDLLLTTAPKLIDEGMQLLRNRLASMAEDKVDLTTVQRNFDTIEKEILHLPSKITLVRGDFAPNKNMQGELYGDGETKSKNQSMLSENKELEIEIEIIQSKDDPTTFYFQPNSYFHHGYSAESEATDEIIIAFAFLSANENSFNPLLDMKNAIHFKNLTPNQQYDFKSNTGYDTSFQSPWITVPLKEVKPYTLAITILEVRKGNSFAKLLHSIYLNNETDIQRELNRQIKHLKKGENEA